MKFWRERTSLRIYAIVEIRNSDRKSGIIMTGESAHALKIVMNKMIMARKHPRSMLVIAEFREDWLEILELSINAGEGTPNCDCVKGECTCNSRPDPQLRSCKCVCHKVGLFGLMCCPCTVKALDELVNGKPQAASPSLAPAAPTSVEAARETREGTKPPEYEHYGACSSSRRVPIGTPGTGCICVLTCKKRMHELEAAEKALAELRAPTSVARETPQQVSEKLRQRIYDLWKKLKADFGQASSQEIIRRWIEEEMRAYAKYREGER